MSEPEIPLRLVFLPGLNSDGDPGFVEADSLKEVLLNLCEKNGWYYSAPRNWHRAKSVEHAAELMWDLLENHERDLPTVIVASSFGAWVAAQQLAVHWPDYVRGVVLVEPMFSIRAYYERQPKFIQWASGIVGYPRFADKFTWRFWEWFFWVSPGMVTSMIDPMNDILKGLLRKLYGRPIVMMHTSDTSRFKPNEVNVQVLAETGARHVVVQPEDVPATLQAILAARLA